MATISRWKVWCDAEGAWRDWWIPSGAAEPTTCPVDSAHAIDATKTYRTKEDVSESGTLADDGSALISTGVLTPTGLQAITALDIPPGASDIVRSWQLVVPAQTIGIEDVRVGGSLVGDAGICYLSGGEYRCRTSAVEGSALHLAVVDRDNVTGAFALFGGQRTKLEGLTNVVGDPSTAASVRGLTSGALSLVFAYAAGVAEISFDSGFADGVPVPWQDGESVEFLDSLGAVVATADTADWTEGDVYEVSRYVEDEWLEGFDVREIRPGGATPVPEGLYFRFKGYNASASETLRVKVSLMMAAE